MLRSIPTTLLGGSWVAISGNISRVTLVITGYSPYLGQLITLNPKTLIAPKQRPAGGRLRHPQAQNLVYDLEAVPCDPTRRGPLLVERRGPPPPPS